MTLMIPGRSVELEAVLREPEAQVLRERRWCAILIRSMAGR